MSVHRKKADSSSSLPDDREKEIYATIIVYTCDTEKREAKKKQSTRKKSAHKRTKNKIFASFFHNPKVERMS